MHFFYHGWVACDRSLIFFLMSGDGGDGGSGRFCGWAWLGGVSEII